MDDLRISPSAGFLAIVCAMPSSAAESLHGALQHDFKARRSAGRLARSRMLRPRAGRSMLSLPSDNFMERHQRCRLLQTPLNQIMERFRSIVEILGTGLDAAGVLIVVGGAVLATAKVLLRRIDAGEYCRRYRQDLGRAILLGLEFLIAGDIIRTVVVAPTLQNVLV